MADMNIIRINDFNAPEMDVFARVTEQQMRKFYEPEEGIFLAESASVILRAIENGYEPLSVLVETERVDVEAVPVFEAVKEYCGEDKLNSMPVYVADRELVTGITGHHLVRGLWMAMRRKPEIPVEEFCRDKRRIAVLMDIVNPVNVGAIFRSAAALGMDGVLLTHKSVDPLTRRVARVSMGTVFQIPWTQASLEESEGLGINRLLNAYGYKTVAMALTDDSISVDSDEIRANEKVAVLLGTEGTGLDKDVIAACDYRVKIPMYHGVDSLNVAAASAISFWELMKEVNND